MANYVSTTQAPSPQALQARRLADLLQQKEANTVEPIRSPWQGVGRVAQSIAGGYDQYLTDQAETGARKDAASQLAAALQGNNLGAAIGAMSDPWTNPEAAKTVAAALSPQMHDFGTYSQAVDRFGNKVGPVLPKQTVIEPTGPEGMKPGPTGIMTGGPNPSLAPIGQASDAGLAGGAPIRTLPNGQIAGNITSPTAPPPPGVVAQRPATPVAGGGMSGLMQQGVDYNRAKEAAKVGAEGQAKYYTALHQGYSGQAAVAANQAMNLDILDKVSSSPNFVPSDNGTALGFQQMAARLGVNPQGAAPREVFNQVAAKYLADQFSGIRKLAEQSGDQGPRIFKSMLEMEEKANLTPTDSLAGIKAKISMAKQLGDLQQKWGDMADNYAANHNGMLDAGFDKQIRHEIANSRLNVPEGLTGQPANFNQRFSAAFPYSRSEIEAEMQRRQKSQQ